LLIVLIQDGRNANKTRKPRAEATGTFM
jgi:hypothetical protein